MPNEEIIYLELYKGTGLESRIEKHHSETIYGGELEALSKRILDLKDADGYPALVEDHHTTCLTELRSLLRDHPMDDASVRSTVQDVLDKCVPPYVFGKDNRQEIASGYADLIRMCIEKIRPWSAFYKAEKLLQELHSSYMDPFKRDAHSNRISITIFGEAKCYHIDLAIAMEILSQDEEGNVVRKIPTGQRVVAAFGGAHWKPYTCFPKPPGSLQPGMAHVIHTWMKLIVGPEIFVAAPTVPISIYGRLPISSPLSPRSSSPRTEPTQYALSGDVIEVGFTVDGICFKDYLILLDTLRAWEKILSPKKFKMVMEDAKNGFKDIIEYTSQIFPDILTRMSEEDRIEFLRLVNKNIAKDADVNQVLPDSIEHKKIFPDILKGMNDKDRFECLRLVIENLAQFIDVLGNQNRAKDSRQRGFYEALEWYLNEGGRIEDVYILIGLISKFPRLSKGRTMIGHALVNKTAMGLLFDIKSTRFLFEKIFPDIPAFTACQWVKELLTKLDHKTTSALFVAFLLVPPGDAKSDNWILQIRYNEVGVISCRIVAIDLGYSLAMPFKLVKVNEVEKLCLTIKNILFLIPEILKRPLHPDIADQILNVSVKHQWATGLCMFALQDSYGMHWINFNKKLNAIDIPVALSPQTLFFLQQQWEQLQRTVREKRSITHEELFEELCPAVFESYKAVPRLAVYQATLIENTVREHQAKEELRGKKGTPQELRDNQWFLTQIQPEQGLSAQQTLKAAKKLKKNPRSIVEEEAVFCDLGDRRDMARLVGPKEKQASLFGKANRQCEDSEEATFKAVNKIFLAADGKPPAIPKKDLTAITLCLAMFRQDIKWKRLSSEAIWEYVKIFCILPPHLLTAQMWQDVIPKEDKDDKESLFQSWLRMAILSGTPLVALRMLQLGAKPNVADPHKKRTAIHEFCDNCLLQYPEKSAQLMAELLFTHPNCEPDHDSIEGTPLLILIRAVLLKLELVQWDKTKKNIFIDVLDHLTRLGINFEAKNVENKTVLDEILETIFKSNDSEAEQIIKIWLFTELVNRGAGIHANGKMLYEAYRKLGNKDLNAAINTLKKRNLSLDWQFSLASLEIAPVNIVTVRVSQKDEDRFSSKQKDSVHIEKSDDCDVVPVESVTSGEVMVSKKLYNQISKNEEPEGFSFEIDEDRWCVTYPRDVRNVGKAVTVACVGNLLSAGIVPEEYLLIFNKINKHGFVRIFKIYPGENFANISKRREDITTSPLSRKSFRVSSKGFPGQTHFKLTPNPYSQEKPIADEQKKFILEHDFDRKSVSAQVMMHLILDCDAYPEDFIYADSIGLVRIINDDSLPELLAAEENETSILCILFCLSAVQEQVVHPVVRAEILSKSPEFLLNTVLRQLQAPHERIKKLFASKEDAQSSKDTISFLLPGVSSTELFPNEEDAQSSELRSPFLLPGTFFSKSFLCGFLSRMSKLQQELQRNPQATLSHCINAVVPGDVNNAFEQYSQPEEAPARFNMLLQNRKGDKKSTIKSMLRPEDAIEMIVKISKEKVSIEYYLELLRQGKVGSLKEIKDKGKLEELFNRFFGDEFHEIEVETYNVALIMFIGFKINFQKLVIRNYDIAHEDFKSLLAASTSLTNLHLANCSKLSDKIFPIIFEKSENLRGLTLQNLPGIMMFSWNGRFNKLKEITITGCKKLTKIDLNIPGLIEGNFSDNEELIALGLNSGRLSSLNVSDCPKLTTQELLKAIKFVQIVPHLDVKRCTEIKPSFLYYISVSAPDLFSRVKLAALEKQIEQLDNWMRKAEVAVGVDSYEFENTELLIEAIGFLLKENPDLTSLKIDFRKAKADMRDKLIVILANGIKNNENLLRLEILDRLNGAQYVEIKGALWPNRTLQEVWLTRDTSVINMNIPVFPDLTTFLECHPKLTSLEINKNNLIKKGREFLELRTPPIWDLSFSSITESDILVIASLITDDTITRVLNFSGVSFPKGTIARLLKALEYNETIQMLDFHACSFSEEDKELLRGWVKNNKTLCVNLDLTDLSVETRKKSLSRDKIELLSLVTKQYLRGLGPKDKRQVGFSPDLFNSNRLSWFLSWEESARYLYDSAYKQGGEDTISLLTPVHDFSAKLIGDVLFTLAGHSKAISEVLFLPEGRIASGSWDNTIKIWDLNEKKCLYTLDGHKAGITALFLFEDIIISASVDNTIKIWSLNEECKGYTDFTLGEHATVMAIIQNGPNQIVSISKDGTIRIWEVRKFLDSFCSRPCEYEERCINNKVLAHTVVKTPNEKLAIGYSDYSIQILDLQQKEYIQTLKRPVESLVEGVSALTQLPAVEGETYGKLISGLSTGGIEIWGWDEEEGYVYINSIKDACSGAILTLLPLSFPGAFISRDAEGNIKVWWPTKTGYRNQLLMRYSVLGTSVNAITQLPTGELVMVLGSEMQIRKDIFSQIRPFHILSLMACVKDVWMTKVKDEVSITFHNIEQLDQKVKMLREFLDALHYSCSARNSHLYDMQSTIVVEEHVIRIQCKELVTQIYNCIFALWKESHMPTLFLEKFASEEATTHSIQESSILSLSGLFDLHDVTSYDQRSSSFWPMSRQSPCSPSESLSGLDASFLPPPSLPEYSKRSKLRPMPGQVSLSASQRASISPSSSASRKTTKPSFLPALEKTVRKGQKSMSFLIKPRDGDSSSLSLSFSEVGNQPVDDISRSNLSQQTSDESSCTALDFCLKDSSRKPPQPPSSLQDPPLLNRSVTSSQFWTKSTTPGTSATKLDTPVTKLDTSVAKPHSGSFIGRKNN